MLVFSDKLNKSNKLKTFAGFEFASSSLSVLPGSSCPWCKCLLNVRQWNFSNLVLAKFYWNLELADLWHFPPRSPPLREPLPVFIKQKNANSVRVIWLFLSLTCPGPAPPSIYQAKNCRIFELVELFHFSLSLTCPARAPPSFAVCCWTCDLPTWKFQPSAKYTSDKIRQIFCSTYLPTRFRSRPRPLWSLKWNSCTEKCNFTE